MPAVGLAPTFRAKGAPGAEPRLTSGGEAAVVDPETIPSNKPSRAQLCITMLLRAFLPLDHYQLS